MIAKHKPTSVGNDLTAVIEMLLVSTSSKNVIYFGARWIFEISGFEFLISNPEI